MARPDYLYPNLYYPFASSNAIAPSIQLRYQLASGVGVGWFGEYYQLRAIAAYTLTNNLLLSYQF